MLFQPPNGLHKRPLHVAFGADLSCLRLSLEFSQADLLKQVSDIFDEPDPIKETGYNK